MISLTLRNASALQSAIKSNITDLEHSLLENEEISYYVSNLEKEINTKKDLFVLSLDRLNNLRTILSDIRKAVGKTNASSGINDLLAEKAMLASKIALYSKFKKFKGIDLEVLNKKFINEQSKLEKQEQSFSYGRTGFSTNFLLQSDINSLIECGISAERELRSINDKILSLNIQLTINISKENYEFLKQLNIA